MPSETIIKKIAQAENTPELRNYWERRFKLILDKKTFEIHEKTLELLENGGIIDKPFTPFCLLNINLLLTENGEIDEVEFQNAIDTAIRLLDNILDVLIGNDQAILVMKDYRKIALGINNYESYLLSHTNQSLGVDTLGNLLSNGAYRASESIAEEKGTCRSWDSIKTNLRNKTFEYWYHTESGKIIDAFSLSKEYTQESVLASGYEIIPRRNSHLLTYPHNAEWGIWSDRKVDYSKKQPTIITMSVSDPAPDQELLEETNIYDSNGLPGNTQTKKTENTNSTFSQISEQPVIKLNSVLIKDPIDHELQVLTTPQPETIADEEINPPSLKNSYVDLNKPLNESASAPSQYSDIIDTKIPTVTITETKKSSDAHNLSGVKASENISDQFQIGELVVISDKNSPFYEQTAQIVDLTLAGSTPLYTLKSTIEALNQYTWRDQQLTSVDLFELLDRINISQDTKSSEQSNVVLQAFIKNEETGEILIINQNNTRQLPEVSLPLNSIPEQAFSFLFKEKYNLSTRLLKEIGSAVEFGTKSNPFKVIIAFTSTVEIDSISDKFQWVSFRDAQFSLSPSARVICNKYNRINDQDLVTYVSDQNTKIVDESNIHSMPQSETSHPVQQSSPVKYQSDTNSISQYIFKLENIVKSEVFGDVTISFRYENNVPILETFTAENLSEDLQFFAETVIHFSNHLLTLEQTPQQIGQFLEKITNSDRNIKMNDLLMLLADSLKNLPS